MQSFGIGELSRRTGVPDSTIRYYERIGLLPPCERHNGKRRYDSSAVQSLSLIRLSQRAGFTIAEIQRLLHDFPADTPPLERWNALSKTKLTEVNELISRLQHMQVLLQQTLQCECSTFEQCVIETSRQMSS